MTGFFIASKLIWGLIRFESWIILGLAVTVWAIWRGRMRLAKWASGLTMITFLAIGLLPLGDLILRPIEASIPVPILPHRIDGIIILGGAEDTALSKAWQHPVFNDAGERLTTAATLARQHPEAVVVYTGGSGSLVDIGTTTTNSADVASRVLTDLGLPAEKLFVETASRNTVENARLSFQMIDPKEGQTWILVTSAFHMPRAARSFEAAGWTGIIPYPTDFRARPFRHSIGWDPDENIHILNLAIREIVGLVAYSATGQ